MTMVARIPPTPQDPLGQGYRPLVDPYTEDWKTIERLANERLANHRATLENPSADHGKDEDLRGRIAELKWLLSLASPQRVPTNPL